MKHCQLVMGPAGSGKSTYCKTIQEFANNTKRTVHVVNMDPAADEFGYSVSFDIRDLIQLQDVMEELQLGPNGGLIYCMDYLTQNFDWLQEELKDFPDDYLLIDLPGQIELYTHHAYVLRALIRELQNAGYNVGIIYCMDSQFVDDPSKFISGTLMCLSAMVSFEVPFISVLTKCDLLQEENKHKALEEYLSPDVEELAHRLNEDTAGPSFTRLNKAIAGLLADYSMVSFVPLDISDEESVEYLLSTIDNAIQYGEDLEPKDPIEKDPEYQDEQGRDMNEVFKEWSAMSADDDHGDYDG